MSGYRVRTAGTGAEGLAALRADPAQKDLGAMEGKEPRAAIELYVDRAVRSMQGLRHPPAAFIAARLQQSDNALSRRWCGLAPDRTTRSAAASST